MSPVHPSGHSQTDPSSSSAHDPPFIHVVFVHVNEEGEGEGEGEVAD